MRAALLIGVPLLVWALIEVALRVFGVGYPTSFFVPVEINGRDMIVGNDRFTWRFLGRRMARQPFPCAVEAKKPADTTRIFVLGESAAYGDPQPEFGLARMLQALLEGRYPGRRFEVVNASMTAINSHALLPLAKDCVNAHADALVVYMGNNEVVGPFGAGTVFGSPAASLGLIRANLALKKLRSIQMLDSLISSVQTRNGSEREWGGMAMFLSHQVRQDDPKMRLVYDHFRRNLGDILEEATRHGVKVAVATVGSNLRDCAPFASVHKPGLPESSLATWETQFQKGKSAAQQGRFEEACDWFGQAARIDDSFAELQFGWGKACLALGNRKDAAGHLASARDADALRFRADARLNEVIRAMAGNRESQGIAMDDAEQRLATRSRDGVPGEEFFYEHVHLTFEGNYQVALGLAEKLDTLLPEVSKTDGGLRRNWPSMSDCQQRLGFSQWHRYRAFSEILSRISDAPFTGQSDHSEQQSNVVSQLAALRPATATSGLREAREQCQSAVSKNPEDWILEKELAAVCERLGDYEAAEKSWRKVVSRVPQYGEGWEQLGRAAAAQKNSEEALDAFQRALGLELNPSVALTAMAELYLRDNRPAEAQRCYSRILKDNPYWSPAQWGLGQVLEASGQTNQAQQHFRAALENRLRTPASYKALGKLCFEKGWLREASTNFADALQLDPFDAATEVNLGLSLALLGDHQQAKSHYLRALELDPDLVEAHVRLGFELGRQGRDAEAMEHFAKAVQLKPDLVEARLDLGISLFNQHRAGDALEQFNEALRLNPTNAIALRYLQKLNSRP